MAEATVQVTVRELPHADTSVWLYCARADGQPVGVLAADAGLDEVSFVGAREAWRRRGITTQLLDSSRRHSGLELAYDGGERSAAGARSLPPSACVAGPCVSASQPWTCNGCSRDWWRPAHGRSPLTVERRRCATARSGRLGDCTLA